MMKIMLLEIVCHNNRDVNWSNASKCVPWSSLLEKIQIVI